MSMGLIRSRVGFGQALSGEIQGNGSGGHSLFGSLLPDVRYNREKCEDMKSTLID